MIKLPSPEEVRERSKLFRQLRAEGQPAIIENDPWKRSDPRLDNCRHLGEPTEEDHQCGGCGDGFRTVWECKIHGKTLPFFTTPDGFQSCRECDDYDTMRE